MVFCLDRVECEELFLKLLSDLEFLAEKKEASEMGQGSSKEAEIELRRARKKAEKERKKREKAAKAAERQKKDEDNNPEIHDGMEGLDGFGDQEQTDYRFTLFNRGDEMDSDDLHYWTRRLLKKTKWPPSHPLLKGLERGIGLHHEGLPRHYRHLVEPMFRARHIKLVVTQVCDWLGFSDLLTQHMIG